MKIRINPRNNRDVLWRGPRITSIHDGQRNLTTCRQRQCDANIRGLDQVFPHRVPNPQSLQRRARVYSGRHSFDQRDGEPLTLEQFLRQVALTFRCFIAWRYQHERVAHQICATIGVYKALVFQQVHPSRVGRDEDISGRALLNLPGQHGRPGIGDIDRVIGRALKTLCDRIKRGVQAGRGENRNTICPSVAHTRRNQQRGETTDLQDRHWARHALFCTQRAARDKPALSFPERAPDQSRRSGTAH